jgi:transcriptional regulator with XRE-family HTH domain
VAAGLSGEQIAERAEISQSRVSRIELGQQAVAVAVAEAWARAAGAEGDDLAAVIELAEAAATQTSSWRGRGLVKLQRDSRQAEAAAVTILNYQSLGIPGLLQVPEYARRVIAAGFPPRGPEDVAAAVKARMDRQVILYEEDRYFEFVIGAAALYWRPGSTALMRAQLDKLANFTATANVTLGVIPLGAEVPGVWCDHSFNILDGPEPLVHVETITTPVNVSDPADIDTYREVFRRLQSATVTGEDARRLILEASRALRTPPT